MKLAKVRGTRDLLSSSAQCVSHVLQTGQSLLHRAGYQQVFLPSLEFEELFSRSLGDGSDIVMKEMFQVVDPVGRRIVLRPEGTVGCMRAYLQSVPGDAVKWQYSGSMFRRERPQHGRYREFIQLGAEAIGLPSLPFVDVELISLAQEMLETLGVKAELRINSLGVDSERKAYAAVLRDYFSGHKSVLSATSLDRLQRNPLRILDSKEEQDRSLLPSAPRLSQFLSPSSLDFFQEVKSSLSALAIPYIEDPWLVRGLDYYSHTCYEFIVEGRAVVAGGRYNSLSRELGEDKDFPGSGWAAGVDRLAELIGDRQKPQSAVGLVAIGQEQTAYCQGLVSRLRAAAPISVHFVPGSLSVSQAMKLLHKLRVKTVILIGEDEIAAQTCKLKDMSTGSHSSVPLSDFPQLLSRLLSPHASGFN